jgi:diguanylate cyclase (GGDEF)-like protein
MKIDPSSLRRWAPHLSWLAAVALAYVALDAGLGAIRARHLKADAEETALALARELPQRLPGLDRILAGTSPGRQTGTQSGAQAGAGFDALRADPDIYRIALYDAAGELRLASDAPAGARRQPVAPRARAVAADGGNAVDLESGDGDALPRVVARAFVPFVGQGAVRGVVEIDVDQTRRAETLDRTFGDVVAAVGGALAAVFALGSAIWRHQQRRARAADERLRYLAQHDALTGTLNRASFGEALAQACRERGHGGPGFAVLCIDLDRFKELNDALGHAGGDELLRRAAERLQAAVRHADAVARLGSDEFAVLQSGVDDAQAVSVFAERIVVALARPYELAGQRVMASASVGAAIHGVDGDDPGSLMHRADLALYRAKSNGRGGYSFYDRELDDELQSRRTLTRELRDALAAGALKLHFQPIWGPHAGRLLGYEALARWPHPTRGFVPPSEFVALAESTGLIDELGRWVLERACREAAQWPDSLSVAVNLSPAQFRRPGEIVEEVRGALAKSGLEPERLELEITESLLMHDTEQVLQSLHALRALGVRIAMDDFGTGYSSLAYLWRFPFDKVKIDRAFTASVVDDGRVDLIVRSIVSLAHALQIGVNAEGVETEAQRERLAAHGCDELQGFLLGRPLPAERLTHAAAAAESAPA